MTTKKPLGKLERVLLRDAWKHGIGDFNLWLAEADNLDILAQALGIKLVLVAAEHRAGDFKLDLLCTDGDQQVIIENQLADTDHKHLGQILTYAAGVGARKVVWVAESFRPEHIAALQFLNDNTTDALDFFGVQVEFWRIGDSPLALEFKVVVRPNDSVKTGREQICVTSSASPTKQLQVRFWTALIQSLAHNAPQLKPQKPQPQNWLNNSIGRSGFQLNVLVNTRSARISVELWMSDENAKTYFAQLLATREDIERRLGFELDWQELPRSRSCRITSYYPNAYIEDETRWEEYFQWIGQRLATMDTVLRPIVKALP